MIDLQKIISDSDKKIAEVVRKRIDDLPKIYNQMINISEEFEQKTCEIHIKAYIRFTEIFTGNLGEI